MTIDILNSTPLPLTSTESMEQTPRQRINHAEELLTHTDAGLSDLYLYDAPGSGVPVSTRVRIRRSDPGLPHPEDLTDDCAAAHGQIGVGLLVLVPVDYMPDCPSATSGMWTAYPLRSAIKGRFTAEENLSVEAVRSD